MNSIPGSKQGLQEITHKLLRIFCHLVQRLIALGAVHIVVPGILPTGCLPLFLTLFSQPQATDFDQHGCLKSFNRLTEYHNSMLQKQVQILQAKHRSTRMMYADYSSQVYKMVQQPQEFGMYFILF